MSTTVFHNATVYTVDDRCPVASAFAIRNGQFLAVGDAESIKQSFPNTLRVDAAERTIVPGFVDAHAHLHKIGQVLHQVDLLGTSSAESVVDRLRAAVAERNRPSNTWIRGYGWDQTDWESAQYPCRGDLDAAFPHRPVWLTRTDGHAGWANTAALDATVGLNRLARLDDPDGGRIDRDDAGRPTGILVDRAMALVEDHIPPRSPSQKDQALHHALRHAVRHGLTGLHDAGIEQEEFRRFQRFLSADRLPLRVYAMVLGRSELFGHFCDRGPYRHPSGRLDVAAVKFFADGALGSRGAALLADYADDADNRGLLRHSPAAFRRHVQTAVDAGFQVGTHAIGDRAVRTVLDAYEAARTQCKAPLRRPRIEHAQVVAPEDRTRFGTLDAIASVQPTHATSDMSWARERLGRPRIDTAYAWKSLQDAGAVLAFGSDAPIESIGPLAALHAATTRQAPNGRPRGGWMPSERLSPATALKAHTLGGAYAAGKEQEAGSITPGKRADFVVLSDDPLRNAPDALLDIEVLATYVEGHSVHTRTPHWSLSSTAA